MLTGTAENYRNMHIKQPRDLWHVMGMDEYEYGGHGNRIVGGCHYKHMAAVVAIVNSESGGG